MKFEISGFYCSGGLFQAQGPGKVLPPSRRPRMVEKIFSIDDYNFQTVIILKTTSLFYIYLLIFEIIHFN